MADTNTTALALLKMEIDSHENDWGGQLNINFDEIDEAIAGQRTHAVTGGTTVLTVETQRAPFHRVTGVLSSNQIFEVPAANPKLFDWKNETTGNFTVTVKVNGQTGVVIPRGDVVRLRNNGTDVLSAASGVIGKWVGTLGFAADAYTAAAVASAPATLVDGLTITGFIDDVNATTTPSLNYGATGAKTIVHSDGTALAAGDMVDGMIASWTYKTSTDKWYMSPIGASRLALLGAVNTYLNRNIYNRPAYAPPSVLADAATIAWDMNANSNNVRIVLTASRALGLPTNMNTGQKGTITILQDGTGNWSLTPNAVFKQAGGQTVFDLDKTANSKTIYSYEVITDHTAAQVIWIKRMWSEDSNSIGLFKEYDKGVLTNSTNYAENHGLGRLPSHFEAWIECTSADGSYAVGDRVLISTQGGDDNRTITASMNTTLVRVRTGNQEPSIMSAGGNPIFIAIAKWKVIFRVYE